MSKVFLIYLDVVDLGLPHTLEKLPDMLDNILISKRTSIIIILNRTELGRLPPVESAASVMREIIYSNKNALSASMICSGWDPYKGY